MPTFINNMTSSVNSVWNSTMGLIEILAIMALAVAALMFFFGGGRNGENAAKIMNVIKVLVAISLVGAASVVATWALSAG